MLFVVLVVDVAQPSSQPSDPSSEPSSPLCVEVGGFVRRPVPVLEDWVELVVVTLCSVVVVGVVVSEDSVDVLLSSCV